MTSSTETPPSVSRLELAIQRVSAFLDATQAKHPNMDEFAREFEGDDHTKTVDLLLSDLRELLGRANAQPVLELIEKLQAVVPVPHGTLFMLPGDADPQNVSTLMEVLVALNGHGGFALVRVDEHDMPRVLPEDRMAELGWVRHGGRPDLKATASVVDELAKRHTAGLGEGPYLEGLGELVRGALWELINSPALLAKLGLVRPPF